MNCPTLPSTIRNNRSNRPADSSKFLEFSCYRQYGLSSACSSRRFASVRLDYSGDSPWLVQVLLQEVEERGENRTQPLSHRSERASAVSKSPQTSSVFPGAMASNSRPSGAPRKRLRPRGCGQHVQGSTAATSPPYSLYSLSSCRTLSCWTLKTRFPYQGHSSILCPAHLFST
jgi:hypothetical protein